MPFENMVRQRILRSALLDARPRGQVADGDGAIVNRVRQASDLLQIWHGMFPILDVSRG